MDEAYVKYMKPLSANTIISIKKSHTLGEKCDYYYLKSRKKIKKKKSIKFIYEVEILEWSWVIKNYKLLNKEISFNTIRSLYQNKKPGTIKKLNTNWDVLKAKILLDVRVYED